MSAGSRHRGTWWAISGCTPGSASQATGQPITAASPRKARPPRVTCWSRPPGSPLAPRVRCRAFAQRIAARRGTPDRGGRGRPQARRALLALLTQDEDYAFKRPSLVRRKHRALELKVGAPSAKPGPPQPQPGSQEPVHRRPRAGRRPTGRGRLSTPDRRLAGDRPKAGCGRDNGARINKALNGQGRAAGCQLLRPAVRHVSHPHRQKGSHQTAESSTRV